MAKDPVMVNTEQIKYHIGKKTRDNHWCITAKIQINLAVNIFFNTRVYSDFKYRSMGNKGKDHDN